MSRFKYLFNIGNHIILILVNSMQKELNELYRITKSDVKYLSMFERAFFNFSVAVALLPNDDIRRNKAHYFYVISIRHMIKYGKAYANSPKIDGVVTWVHSDYKEASTWQMIKFGALKAVYKLGAKNIKKAIDLSNRSWMNFYPIVI